MNDKVNKTSICSIAFLDIVEYSKKTDSEQIDIKNQFNKLINIGLKEVAQNERIILDTGDGAVIAFNGSPEDALFSSMTIHDEILKSNIHSPVPIYIRLGINLGPVRFVNDINGQPNIIGDGINVAQRIMSFASPNQIIVSRSYFDVTSRLTHEISQMFEYLGVKYDKHMREHEIYSVRLLSAERSATNKAGFLNSQKWIRKGIPLRAFVALVIFLTIGFLWKVNQIEQEKLDLTNMVESKVQPEEKVLKSPNQSLSENTDPNSSDSSKSKQVKIRWDNFKESVKKGSNDPSCTPAQSALKQCP